MNPIPLILGNPNFFNPLYNPCSMTPITLILGSLKFFNPLYNPCIITSITLILVGSGACSTSAVGCAIQGPILEVAPSRLRRSMMRTGAVQVWRWRCGCYRLLGDLLDYPAIDFIAARIQRRSHHIRCHFPARPNSHTTTAWVRRWKARTWSLCGFLLRIQRMPTTRHNRTWTPLYNHCILILILILTPINLILRSAKFFNPLISQVL